MLRLPYDWDTEKMPGRVVIDAKWQPYTKRELLDMETARRRRVCAG